jgi:hypothetical protein
MTLATTMHLTALILVPVFFLGSRVNKLQALIIASPFFMAGYYFSLDGAFQHKANIVIQGYLWTGYSSSGAAVRVAMNALPAFLYFVIRGRLKFDDDERRFMDIFALIGLAFIGVLYLSPSSTAVDRMALYIIPIQLVVLGRLPLALARTGHAYQLLAAGVIVYSGAVMFVWLNFAVDANAWVPYSLVDADSLVGLSY